MPNGFGGGVTSIGYWYPFKMILPNAVSPKAVQCEAFFRRHSGSMSRGNNEAMGRFWADPKGAKQAALCRVALARRSATMPSPVRLAENGLLNAALGNIILNGY
jgi:hypothetical protein